MTVSPDNLRSQLTEGAALRRSGWARKLVWWIIGIVAAIGVFGALLAPPLVRHKLESDLSAALHRKVSIQSLRINPYALTATVRGVRIQERDSDATAAAIDGLYADVSAASLFRLAPVLASMRADRPQIKITRIEGSRYNWSDLIDEFLAKPRDPNQPPPRFSVANIEIADGAIEFDDRPEKSKHAVTGLQLAIPFISSLPVYQDISVEPKFSAQVDGAPLQLNAEAKPFKDPRDAIVSFDLHGLDLTKYLNYIPGLPAVDVRAARLETALKLTFAKAKDSAPTLVLSGSVALRDVDLQEPGGAPLVKSPRVDVELRSIEPLLPRVDIAKITIASPQIRVHHRADGEFYLLRLFRPKSGSETTSSSRPAIAYKIDQVLINDGKVDVLDERGARPVRLQFDQFKFAMHDISSAAAARARVDAYLHSTSDAAVTLAGTLAIKPLSADGTIKLEKVHVSTLWPLVEPFVAIDALDGETDITSAFTYSAVNEIPNVVMKNVEIAVRSLKLRQRWDKQDLLIIPSLALHGGSFDLVGRTINVVEVTSNGGFVALRRDKHGKLNLRKLTVANAEEKMGTAGLAPSTADAAATAKSWSVAVQKVNVDGYVGTFDDENAGPAAASARIEDLSLTASDVSTAKGQRSNIALKLKLNKTGSLAASGPVSFNPVSARLKIDARNLGIVPVQPYFAGYINAIVSSGDITTAGEAAVDVPEHGTPRATYKGDITIANFASVTKGGNEDLLRWKSFRFGGVDLNSQPLKVAIAEIALSDFFTRLVVTPEGRLNLQRLLVSTEALPRTAGSLPARVASVTPPPAATDPGLAAPVTETSGKPPLNLQIGKVTLANGNVNFSDYFVKPNYSANLTGLTGSVSAMSREVAGDVALQGHIDGTAPVVIAGKINALAENLYLDVKAEATDIELPSLTTYSEKYVGYGIERGKLSMKVAYQLENRKLAAQNKIILNQLTFGNKVDSPTATKLPVLFAVSLLKDRNGVIDVDLPVSGSIDDPQFSMGAIIGRLIADLIVKVITSPFALIGSLFGGSGGEELSYIEFEPGSVALTPAAHSKLDQLGKALNDRPAIKLDIGGRVDGASDNEGLKRAALDRKVKTQKLKDTVKDGGAAGSLEQITLEPSEYPKYLSKAYAEEKFDKPRNMIGLAKELPVPEMEQLMLANMQVSDADLRALADHRAQKVKDYLLETGKIPADRIFLVSPKLSADGIKDKGKPTRVDLALK